MDLIERYIYAVVKSLPPKQRPDIEKELRGLIEDMLQKRTGGQAPQPSDIEAVLLELGEPRKLADNYRGTSRYLISPAFFDIYWLVLRIVLMAVGLGILVATAVRLVSNPPDQAWKIVADLFASLFNALLGAFGMVTLIFSLNEHFNDQAREKLPGKQEKWQPSQLPFRPASGLLIKRSEPIVALIFTVIFLVIININLNMLGIYIKQGDTLRIIPLFSDYFKTFLPWINLSLVLAIVLEGVKLILGRWTIPLVIGSIAQKTLSLVIGLRLFADTRLFNDSFITEMNDLFGRTGSPMPADLAARVCQVMIIILVVGFVLDVLTTGWKAVRIALDR